MTTWYLQLVWRPSEYATHLLEVSQSLPARGVVLPALAFIGRHPLERRLSTLLDPAVIRTAPGLRAKSATMVAVIGVLLALTATRTLALAQTPGGQAPEPKSQAAKAESAEGLKRALSASDPDIRKAAALGIAATQDQDAAPQLRELSKSHDPATREAGLQGLAAMRVNDHAAYSAGLKDSDPGVRRAAAMGLATTRDAGSTTALIDVLSHDADPEVRTMSATALGAIGDAHAIPALIQATKDSNSSVRRFSVAALGFMGDRQGQAAVRAALNDSDPDVRAAAAISLAKFDGRTR